MRSMRATMWLATAAAVLLAAPDGRTQTSGSGPAGAAARAEPAAKTSSALPAASEVLARFRKAIGGEQLIRKFKTRRAVGRFELPAQGIGGPFELVAAAPNRMVFRIELAGLGLMSRGFDGTTGWAVDPAVGPRVLSGQELDEMRYSAEFYADLYEPGSYKSITVVERAPFEGQDCYAVKLVRPSGFETMEFFDVASGLRVGGRMNTTSAMGTVPAVTTVFSGYKRFDGVLMATVARQRAMGIESVLTIDKVEHGAVPPDAFALPPGIAELAKP
jgi:hypothetical protein